MKRVAWTAAALAAGVGAVLLFGVARGQQTLQQGFEGPDPLWTAGAADAAYKETAHRITDEFARGGRRSETIALEAGDGNYIYYTYDIGKATLDDVLNVSLWIKANRPGVELLCRVVLPQEHDPQHLDQPLTTLIKADEYQITGRWQQLTLKQPMKRLREQLQLMRAGQKRDVIGAGAYIDRLVLNVCSGKGTTQVWIDDLEVSPVDEAKRPADPIATTPTPGQPVANRRSDVVQLEGKQFLVDGKPFFPLIIRNTGTPPKALYDAGFNVIALDESTPSELLDEAVALGFKVMPSVTPPPAPDEFNGRPDGLLTANTNFAKRMSRFLDQGSLLSWNMGGSLGYDQFKAVSRSAQAFHAVDPMRPIAVDVSDGCLAYSRGVEPVMLGVHRFPLSTGMELTSYRDWLTERRQLAQPGAFCWTWIQTHVPDWFLATAYDRDASGAVTEPLGPQAEQNPPHGLHGDRQRLPRPRLLVRPLPGRLAHRPRSAPGPGPAQPGNRDAGADFGGRAGAGLDRHVPAGGQGGRHPHQDGLPGSAHVDRQWRSIRARSGRRAGAGRVRADGPAVVGGVGGVAGRGAVAEAGARHRRDAGVAARLQSDGGGGVHGRPGRHGGPVPETATTDGPDGGPVGARPGRGRAGQGSEDQLGAGAAQPPSARWGEPAAEGPRRRGKSASCGRTVSTSRLTKRRSRPCGRCAC